MSTRLDIFLIMGNARTGTMSKYKKSNTPQHVQLLYELLKDPEWRNLSSSAKIVYIYLRANFKHKTLTDLSLTYKEMEDMMSRPTISSAFKELIKKKFIKKIKAGGLFGGKCEYKLIGKYKDFYYKGTLI